LSVTAFIAIVSKAHAHILRLSRARLHDLVASDWTARAVLRYWRLQRRLRQPLSVADVISPHHGTILLGHGVVLVLGFVLVASALNTPTSARESSSQLLWNAPLTAANAAYVHQVFKAESLEVGPTPVATPTPPPPAQGAAPKPAPVVGTGTFTPPPGSGGDGLAAIQAVFANSPGLSWALRVANCESHYNPLAVNRYSGASGLFQFMPSTWNANFPGQNIWDPYAQARAALVFYNAGRQSAWTCK
jgi:transglycosylase-like protein with SLT domain